MVVSSGVRPDDIALSLRATAAGALAVVAKPEGPASPRFEEDRAQLVAMVKAMADVKVVRRWGGAPRGRRPGRADARPALARAPGGPRRVHRRPRRRSRPSSRALPAAFPVPVLVVQHMSRGFVGGAGALARLHHGPARQGRRRRRAPASPGVVYLAPDDRHLGVTPDGTVELSATPPQEASARPRRTCSAPPPRPTATALLAVILTGMGSDGVGGLRAAHAAGALVLAQDEASSVIYGMPREAVQAGVVGGRAAARIPSGRGWRSWCPGACGDG